MWNSHLKSSITDRQSRHLRAMQVFFPPVSTKWVKSYLNLDLCAPYCLTFAFSLCLSETNWQLGYLWACVLTLNQNRIIYKLIFFLSFFCIRTHKKGIFLVLAEPNTNEIFDISKIFHKLQICWNSPQLCSAALTLQFSL